MIKANIDPARLAWVMKQPLKVGGHRAPFAPGDEYEMCIMEAAAYIAGERWTEYPDCVAPQIVVILQSINDKMLTDEDRHIYLKPLIERIIDTSDPSAQKSRKRDFICIDYAIRVFMPVIMDSAGLTEQSSLLRKLSKITNKSTAGKAARVAQKAWGRSGRGSESGSGSGSGRDSFTLALKKIASATSGKILWGIIDKSVIDTMEAETLEITMPLVYELINALIEA
jgi:hypothetical protein